MAATQKQAVMDNVDVPVVHLVMHEGGRPRKACVMCWTQPSKKCEGCMSAHYCSLECQLSAWPKHKPDCLQMQTILVPLHNDHLRRLYRRTALRPPPVSGFGPANRYAEKIEAQYAELMAAREQAAGEEAPTDEEPEEAN
jgi:hypothetical protein